jgi:hypothetical protein
MNPFTSAKAPQTMAALPPDLAVQQQQLDRQRLMAEMLRKQGAAPDTGTEMISGWAVKKSPMEGLSKIAQALGGRYLERQADEKQTELTKASGKQLAETLAAYQSDMAGTPAQPGGAIAADGYGPETPAVPAGAPNKQAALARLLQSGNPMLQQIGMQQILKGEEGAKWSSTPHYDQDGKAFILNDKGERRVLDGVLARDKVEIAPSGVSYNPYSVKPGTVFNDANKIMSIGPDGQPVVNEKLVGVKKEIGRASAPSVNVKTDVKMGEGLGKEVGPMMRESTSIAEGAVKQVDAAQRIVKAIEGDKAFSGPLSNTRLKVAQVSQMLGVGGKDEAEKIANTRSAMRGMAELTLQGRQQMKGQGAITESEGQLAEKAMSGNIEDLTGAEIKQLAKASERAARFNYGEHQRKLKVMQANPALQGIAPFYEGPGMPAEVAPPAAPASGGFSIRKLP